MATFRKGHIWLGLIAAAVLEIDDLPIDEIIRKQIEFCALIKKKKTTGNHWQSIHRQQTDTGKTFLSNRSKAIAGIMTITTMIPNAHTVFAVS